MATATARKPAKGKAKKSSAGNWGGISDEAVKKATGCDWKAWIFCLDKAGCAKMSHKEIAELVYERWPKVGGWWSQMVTVGYEQARGLRVKNQTSDGWKVSSSKTVSVPVKTLFGAWKDPKKRAAWLKDAGRPFALDAAMAKLYTGELSHRVANNALQIHGGYGFMEESPISRLYRDQKILEIGEGTNEVQRMVISRHLGL